LRSRILLGTIFGTLGGFVGFVLQEFFTPHNVGLAMTLQDLMKLGMLVGAALGVALGAVEGASVGSPRLLMKGMLIGLFVGALGGIVGAYVGGVVYQWALFGKDADVLVSGGNILDFTHAVLARALGWTFLGAFPGLAAGAATLSRKRATHGLAGGLIGGFLGGFAFDLIATVIATPIQGVAAAGTGVHKFEAGGLSRAIGFTLIGLLTGLFIGLVEEYFKQAWVRVLAGNNEGRDYILSKPLTVLGRDERADVPLFGDPGLSPQHAAIRMENGRHTLLDGGAQMGSVVNGQPVQQQLLRDGDMIQLGQVRLLFREKATASKVGRPVADAPKSAQAPGSVAMPSHLCAFCGAAKDAQGNCLCSVPGTAPVGAGMAMGAPMGPPTGPATGFSGNYGDPMGFSAPPAPFGDPGFGGAPPMGGGMPYGGGMAGGSGIGSRLMALDGPYAGQAFMLGMGENTIGRAPENTLAMVNDTTVSRRHAHINDEGGRHVLYDDGSSNGTFVNNVRVTIQPLAPGDIIQLGASKYRYE
jgi:pSer/pThr/pTyr-binding forkhead associated (FHA) protein